ncbi:MAG: uracil-xanthine permease family protein, partial [Desulfovibrionaceae bacterium]
MKPANLIYGVDDKPPLWVGILLGFQHVSLISIGLVFPVLVTRSVGAGPEAATMVLEMSMIAAGLAVILQALKRGPIGSGYLCPSLCGPSFLSASLLAVKTGGLSLLFGMTLFAGVAEGLFSRVIKRLRVLFPSEVTGLIVAMVGITVIKLAGANFLGLDETDQALRHEELLVALFTLAAMVGLNVWTRGQLRLFCILIGMILGYVASWLAGVFGPEEFTVLAESSWLSQPFRGHPGWSFDWSLAAPFLIAMVCSSLKTVGDLTTCQKINDTEWKRPDMENIGKGVLADAAGCALGGLLGGLGQSSSSSNIGLSIATGATSRRIALFIGGILVLLAFCPKLAAIFVIMPRPVVGATVVFSLCFMVVAGIQIIMMRMIDARKTFVIGLSMIFGLMVDMLPGAFAGLPGWLAPVFSSSLSAATVLAVVLNLCFRIGVASKAVLELERGGEPTWEVVAFMQRQGGAWGARPDV